MPPLKEVDLSELSVRLGAIRVRFDTTQIRRDCAIEVRLIDPKASDRLIEVIAADDRPEPGGLVELLRGLWKKRLALIQEAELIVNLSGRRPTRSSP